MREPQQKLTASEKGKIVVYSIKSVINKRFPSLLDDFLNLPSNRERVGYSMCEILAAGLFMFIFKEQSRNAYNNDRQDVIFAKNYFQIFKLRLPHPDTIDNAMRTLSPELLEELKANLVKRLFETKILRSSRFLNKFYFVAVDATGTHTFNHKHCEHCLKKESAKGVVTYFHYVLEAKLVTHSGFSISIATEFIENKTDRIYEKQDCEQKAFVRLAAKIKQYYPRLPICILGDGLYPNSTVFDICRNNQWQFIITLRDGNLKTVQTEVMLLQATKQKQTVFRTTKTEKIELKSEFLNDIEYDKHLYSWICCIETVTNLNSHKITSTQFAYIASIKQTKDNVLATIEGGRLRWKIENEGFNTQKNLGYELEHKYSRVSYTAMQNYYQLLQLAHMINQFVEKKADFEELLESHSKQTISDLWKSTSIFLHSIPYTLEQYTQFLST